MESDRPEIYPRPDYAPHILSGAEARRQSGRRTPGLGKASGCFPWYTTYMIDQGPFTIIDPDQGTIQGEGPAVICLPPNPRTRVRIPPSTLYSWLEWGAVRLPLTYRDNLNASRKYPEGYQQPQAPEIWGLPLPIQLPAYASLPTSGMMLRANASWWKGGAHRMLADAELTLWIARYLFPPEEQNEGSTKFKKLFPSTSPKFQKAVGVLEKSLAMSVDVRDWALALELSPRSLQRWCREESGLSPQGILDILREQRATHLLREKNDPLRNVAKVCGFASASAFSAWFSRKKGISPARWRAGLREKNAS